MSRLPREERNPDIATDLIIEARGVAKVFPKFAKDGADVHALAATDFSVKRGEFVSLVGPSGCGKSTLLNLIAGLLTPSSGVVMYNDQPITSANTSVGYVTQKDNLIPWRTVEQNLMLPLEIRNYPKADRKAMVQRSLELVGLTGFAKHYPAELSGGMRKRVTLARTLIYEPEAILMDEPFSALDAQTRFVLQTEFLATWQKLQQTVVFVTHDLREAILLSDRIVLFSARPGTILKDLRVPLPRPRDVTVEASPVFAELHRELWESLEFNRGGAL